MAILIEGLFKSGLGNEMTILSGLTERFKRALGKQSQESSNTRMPAIEEGVRTRQETRPASPTRSDDLCAFLDSYAQLVQSLQGTITNESGRGRTNDVLAEMGRRDLGLSLSLTFAVLSTPYAKDQAREIVRRMRYLEEALEVVAQLAGSRISPLLELAVAKDLMVLGASRKHVEKTIAASVDLSGVNVSARAQATDEESLSPRFESSSAGSLARLKPLSFRLDSPRVATSAAHDGMEIALRWACDDHIVARHTESDAGAVSLSHLEKRVAARLPVRIDVAAFLASAPSPPDDVADPPALYWAHLLLLHPSAAVVIEVLRHPGIESFFDLWSDVAMLLICGSDEVREAAAQAVWRLDDFGAEFVLNVLANRGMIPSGILFEEASAALPILKRRCPPDRLAFCQQTIEKRFGAALAGTSQPGPPPEVHFKERYRKAIDSVTMGTYEVYTAPSQAAGRAFLAAYPITEDYFYVEIETPEGPIGKDKMGIY